MGAFQCGWGTGGAVTAHLAPANPAGTGGRSRFLKAQVPLALLQVADSAVAPAPLCWLALVLLGLGAVTPDDS